MKAEVKVPPMGESISDATVATIIKPTGSKVSMDDEILELETDKVNQVLYAPQAGILTLNVTPGQKVAIGQVLGSVDTNGKEEPQKTEPAAKKEAKKEQKEPEKVEGLVVQKSEAKPARLGKEEFLKDLKQPEKQVMQAAPASKADAGARETRRKMSSIRKVIASRMVEVKNTTAMLTTFNEVDMSQIIALRDKYKDAFLERHGVKLGFMSFFVKACVSALQHFPDVNSYIDGDEIVHRDYFDIGMAVGTDRGVIVPVVRNCDQISYPEIELSIEQFAKKAREGSISVGDLQGGSFTITNGGVYGSMLSTPIINPNQSAILGLHKISKRAVVVDDQIVIRPIMYLALSYDHRIIDGKEAVSFLVHVKNALEYPASSLLGI
jgi:2-oxoglutarate dehydrogenase E2 component (dihydrolipoamide succinyltransferase)